MACSDPLLGGFKDLARAPEQLYVGSPRAWCLLVVVGDQKLITGAGGGSGDGIKPGSGLVSLKIRKDEIHHRIPDMALIRKLEKGNSNVRPHDSEVDATYQILHKTNGQPLLHIATYGSDYRQSEP